MDILSLFERFQHKAISMPFDAHCIMIGEPENRAVDICEMATCLTDCIYEAPVAHITDLYWRETIVKVC